MRRRLPGTYTWNALFAYIRQINIYVGSCLGCELNQRQKGCFDLSFKKNKKILTNIFKIPLT